MEKFQNGLMKAGQFAAENKYLSAIKDAFQSFVPFTIIGALGILWSNVLVNDQTGLGAIFSPIMALKVLNPAFDALNFATISCMTLAIAFLIGGEIANKNGLETMFGGILSVGSLLVVSQSSYDVMLDGKLVESVGGVFSGTLGSSGLFTGMIIGIVSVEIFSFLFSKEFLKIKMPKEVPAQIAKSFEYLIPGFITMAVVSLLGLVCFLATGNYINDLIFNLIQTPLLNIGGSIFGIIIFSLIAGLFWSVGLHGDNMISGVFMPILTALIAQNQEMVDKGLKATNIVNFSWFRIFSCTGGTGMVLGLSIAMFLVAKRPENKSIAGVAMIPNLFNIGEVNMFGCPVVLNPILIIPFVLTPIITLIFGYVITVLGLCPIMYLNVPWTMPPGLYGFIASGGNFMAGIWQLVAVAISVLIYIPFVKVLEKQQAAVETQKA